MKKIVEVPKKIKPNENNNNKKGKERVSTPKGKSKLRIRDKPDKLDFNKTIVVKNKGHISKDDGVCELNEILDECIKMMQ